jgi:apolipoprotein D and lipocalin family protein
VPRLVLAAALVLSACTARPTGTGALRAPDAPIWSAAAFQPTQIAGNWRQVAGFEAAGSNCNGGDIGFQPVTGGLQVRGNLCLNGAVQPVSGLAETIGPGRLRIKGQEDWWILWVDSGYRTLAIGTPSGRFGFILDRGAIPADRLEAAREVLDFNGYATGALRAY